MLKKIKWTWRDMYRMPVVMVLWPIVFRNYRLRFEQKLPDEWHWADRILLSWGYVVEQRF